MYHRAQEEMTEMLHFLRKGGKLWSLGDSNRRRGSSACEECPLGRHVENGGWGGGGGQPLRRLLQ